MTRTGHLIFAAWAACALLSDGLAFNYFQHEYKALAYRNMRRDAWICALLSMGGPLSLPGALKVSEFGKHGWSLLPVSKADSWDAFHTLAPRRSYECFETGHGC